MIEIFCGGYVINGAYLACLVFVRYSPVPRYITVWIWAVSSPLFRDLIWLRCAHNCSQVVREQEDERIEAIANQERESKKDETEKGHRQLWHLRNKASRMSFYKRVSIHSLNKKDFGITLLFDQYLCTVLLDVLTL